MFDPAHPTLKARLASGDCLGVAWLSLGSVALVETAARSRPDAIVIDLQHGLWERRELEAAIGIVPPMLPVIVRVAENSALAIGTALDAGAEGVMVPMVESAEQARHAVQAAHYPPRGRRSGGGVRPLQDFPAYLQGAGDLAVIVMIETAAGLDKADAIARVKGIDMVFVGTGDLGLSLQVAGSDPRHAQACARIKQACDAAKLPCGVFTGTLAAAQQHREQGYRMAVLANDIDLVARGFAAAADGFRAAAQPASPASPVPRARKPAARAA